MPDTKQLLARLRAGDADARNQLFEDILAELRQTAARVANGDHNGTLNPTALVNEAYAHLFKNGPPAWKDRRHVIASMAICMRHILIDHVRRRRASKRTPEAKRVSLDEHVPLDDWQQQYEKRSGDLLALDAALQQLALVDADQVRLIELHFFSGMSLPEAAAVMDISARTAARWWLSAKAWLARELAR